MIVISILIGAASFLVTGYLWFRHNFSYWEKHEIPHERGFLNYSTKNIVTCKTNFALHLQTVYSDPNFQNDAVVGIYAQHRPALLIRKPELLHTILNNDVGNFKNRCSGNDPHRDPFGVLGVFFTRNKVCPEICSKVRPVFGCDMLKHRYPVIQALGKHLEKLLQQGEKCPVTEIKHLENLYTTGCIYSTIFDMDTNDFESAKGHRMATKVERVRHFISFRAKILFKETDHHFVKSSLSTLISDREYSGLKHNDIIDILIELKQKAAATGADIKTFMEDATAQTTSFICGGYESSLKTISNALFQLAKHPEVQQALQKECAEAFRDNNGEMPYEALTNMEYLNMVVHETLRLHPVVHLFERAYHQSHEGSLFPLKPYCYFKIPDGMAVYISTTGLHYDAKYWPNPELFDPERFTAENKKLRHPMVYLPFGAGPRNCLGAGLALLQVKTFLVYFLKNYSVKLCDQTNLKSDVDAKSIVLLLKGGVRVELIRAN